MVLSEAKKKAGVYCCAYACKNNPVKKLGGLCYKHYRRKRREIDPVYCRYNNFKSNATARGKDFTITLTEFRRFCDKTGYLKNGYRGFRATIDRICNAHGYHIWNIQILSHKANCSKGAGFSENDFPKPEDFDDSEIPF